MPYQRRKPANKRQTNPHSLSLPNTAPLANPVMYKGDLVVGKNWHYKNRLY